MENSLPRLFVALLVVVLSGWTGASHGSLLDDDAITFSVELTTSSGNAISTTGSFSPGADVYCLDFSVFGPCPPGPLFDTEPLDNTNADADLFLLFNAENETISMFIGDSVVGLPEFVAGTVTFSNIGWGEMDGRIVGVEICGIGPVGCGPDFGFEVEFSRDALTIGIDSFLAIFSSSSGTLSGIAQITAKLEVEPAPATGNAVPAVPVPGLALTALGLGIFALRRLPRAPFGKVELYSSVLEELGFDPLPYHREGLLDDTAHGIAAPVCLGQSSRHELAGQQTLLL